MNTPRTPEVGRKFSKILSAAFILFTIAGCSSVKTNEAKSGLVEHVVLISLDGSRPEFYLDSSWDAPNLRKFKEEGVYTQKGVKSVFPSFTYPSHTSMITGAYPIRHGIYNNTPYDGIPGQWLSDATDIQSKTIWTAVKEAGMTSGAVMWPVTVDAPIDYNFPERFPMKGEEDKNKLTIMYPYVSPDSLLSEIEEEMGRKLTPDDLNPQKNFNQSKTIAMMSKYIIKKYKPNLMGIHMIAMDHQQHAHGVESPQLRDAVHITDSLIGTIVQTIKDAGIWEKTAIVFIGDHGHANTMSTFSPNTYLAKKGIIKGKKWRAKFHAAGGSSFLYLNEGVDEAIVDTVVEVLKESPEYEEGYFRIFDRSKLDEMKAATNASLAIAMKEGTTAGNSSKAKPLVKKDGSQSTHGYDPNYPSMYTAFIASGAGIGGHKEIEGMEVVDIAPIVSTLLGLDFKSPDGKLLPGIIKE